MGGYSHRSTHPHRPMAPSGCRPVGRALAWVHVSPVGLHWPVCAMAFLSLSPGGAHELPLYGRKPEHLTPHPSQSTGWCPDCALSLPRHRSYIYQYQKPTPKPRHRRLGLGHPALPPLPPIFQFSAFRTWASAVSSLTLMGSILKGSYFLFTNSHLSAGLNSLPILLNSIVSGLQFLWS